MDATEGKHWIDDAKCSDPFRIGCTWSGRMWVQLKPTDDCMPCPNCTGKSFSAMLQVRRTECTARLTGFTL